MLLRERNDRMYSQEQNELLTKVEQLQRERGISQNEVGKLVGISGTALSQIKNGKYAADPQKVFDKIAEYFGVPVSYFYGTEEESGLKTSYQINEETARKAQEIFEDKETRILLDAKRDLSPEDLDYVIRTIKMLKEKERGEE